MVQNLRVVTQSGQALPWINWIWVAVVVGCVYILSAKLSLSLLTPEGVAVFWPAAGIAAGTLIALGPNARWAVVAGTMVATVVANLLGDRNVFSSIVFAVCNAGEALIAAGLIERYFDRPFSLDRLRHVLGLLGAAVVAAAASGIGGTLGFALFHDATAPILVTWQNWFASDALGIVTVAPLVIGLASAARDPPSGNETVEGLVALVSLVLISAIVIALPQQPWTTLVPIALLFPVLLWIAARCPPVFAAAAAFIVTLAIVFTTTIGIGHFGDPGLPMADRVPAARAGIVIVALCAFVLAALFAERREQEAALAASEARVQEALTAGAVTTFVWDIASGASQRSANAAQILGLSPSEALSSEGFLSRVNPDDRDPFKALVRALKPERPAYTTTFRFRHGNGREVWLEETGRAEFDAAGRVVRLKGLTLDVTTRKRFEDQQSTLIAALDRRLKNLLSRLALLAKDTRHGSDSIDAYAQGLDQRIQSIAEAYALLSRNHWDGVELGELVRAQLSPYATDANATLVGPPVTLSVAATQALASVLHELVTNAAKYGALSSPHGRVELSWSRAGANLSFLWREIGGPAVAPSPDSKYGVRVIRELIVQELNGSVDLTFPSSGVCCKIDMALDHQI